MITVIIGDQCSGKESVLRHLEMHKNYEVIPYYSTIPFPVQNNGKGTKYEIMSKEELDKSDCAFIEKISDEYFIGIPFLKDVEDKDYAIVVRGNALVSKNIVESFCTEYGKDNVFVAHLVCPKDIRKERGKINPSFNEKEWNKKENHFFLTGYDFNVSYYDTYDANELIDKTVGQVASTIDFDVQNQKEVSAEIEECFEL